MLQRSKRVLLGAALMGLVYGCGTETPGPTEEAGAKTVDVGSHAQPLLLGQLTDRCTGDVIIVPGYDNPPNTPGAILLQRGANGSSGWSNNMTIASPQFRWYCLSTSPFAGLDPGTWRITDPVNFVVSCVTNPLAPACWRHVQLGGSAINGWYPERSTCPAGTNQVRAYLGPNRLLRIDCHSGSLGSDNHFYTTSAPERDYAIGLGFIGEGSAAYVHGSQVAGTVPLFRLLAPNGRHFYTMFATERDLAISNGYRYEGIAAYVFASAAPGTSPLYRLHNPTEHFYTIWPEERDNAIRMGFALDGIATYVYATQVPGTTPLYRLNQP